MVRICNAQKTNIEKYYDGEYAGWDSEKDGNKVFEIPLSGTDTATGGYFNYSFSKQFNIFSDFGIDKNETLGSLSLVFRVLDESNSSTVEVLNLTGDIEAPKLEITTLKVKNADDTEKETKSLSNGNIPILSIFNKDSSGNVTDKIQYSGTW